MPVDAASLAAFRVLFGCVMFASSVRFLANGWVERFFIEPEFHFTYAALPFLRPWPGAWMSLHFAAMAALALGVALGFHYRFCAVVFALAFSYTQLVEKALYLNHYYLVSLLAALLALLPAGRALSVDAWLAPKRSVATIPAWSLYVLRFQVAVVYFFAGVAKLNRDWLFDAQPLRVWLAARSDVPWVGPALAWPELAYAASWIGALFDLVIVAFLLWRRSRRAAWLVALGFHAVTGYLFPIGMFPWVMAAASTLFFAPDWPRSLLRRCASSPAGQPPVNAWSAPRWLLPLLLGHCLIQAALPLRQHFEESPSAWTLRSFDFSWNVMVAEKAGQVSFVLRDRRSGALSVLAPESFLAPFQEQAMAKDPELIRQAALHVATSASQRGLDVAVYADAVASLNGRPAQRLIDPRVDLTGPLPESWILPLDPAVQSPSPDWNVSVTPSALDTSTFRTNSSALVAAAAAANAGLSVVSTRSSGAPSR